MRLSAIIARVLTLAFVIVGSLSRLSGTFQAEQVPLPVISTSTAETEHSATDDSLAATSRDASGASSAEAPILPSLPDQPDAFGCYYRRGNEVVVNATGTPVTLPGADVETFVDLSVYGNCFGKDQGHVWRYSEAMEWADPRTFSVLQYQRGPIILFRNANEVVAWAPAGSEYSGPTGSSTPFYTSAGGSFYIVPDGDPNTFQVFTTGYDIGPWARDKNNVYCEGKVIDGANPSRATIVNLTPDTGGNLSVAVNGITKIYEGCNIVSVYAL